MPPLIQIMACRLIGVKPISEPMMTKLDFWNKFYWNFIQITKFIFKKNTWPFCLDLHALKNDTRHLGRRLGISLDDH